jgi:hypothetical protein
VTTVADHPAAPTYQSRPRTGFKLPTSARKFAAICLAEGITADEIRIDTVPGDMLLTELADAMDTVVPAPRTAPAATGSQS